MMSASFENFFEVKKHIKKSQMDAAKQNKQNKRLFGDLEFFANTKKPRVKHKTPEKKLR